MKTHILIRLTTLILTLTIALPLLSSCGDDTVDTLSGTDVSDYYDPSQLPEIEYNELRLAYSKSDSLDPFSAKSSMNRQLTTLMYDGLFTVSETYEPIPVIASSYTGDELSVSVTVNTGVYFTDGTEMTPNDIVYSFDKAKESPVYSSRLQNFTSATATGINSILFMLEKPDPYAAACLDFPIIKTGTALDDLKKIEEALSDEDKENSIIKSIDKKVPTGSGRFMLVYEENEPDPSLVAHNRRFGGFFPEIGIIKLVNVTNSDALFYSLEIGNISFAFDDLSSGVYTRVSANTNEYHMNNLVYVGLNQDDPALANHNIRKAIALSIDRENILNIAFQGHAQITYTPFNPMWRPINGYIAQNMYDREASKEILENAGYKQINSYGYRNNGKLSLTFKMIVCEGNNFKLTAAEQIKKSLAALDINVDITVLAQEDFLDAVELGHFDMYIGEVSMLSNMSLDSFFGGKGAMAHGIWARSAADAYYGFLAGENTINDFMTAFENEVPFIPLCFRNGIAAGIKELNGSTDARYTDLYEDIESWKF